MALAVRVPVSEVRTGDVVSVTTAQGSRVTHRVVSRTRRRTGAQGRCERGAGRDALPNRHGRSGRGARPDVGLRRRLAHRAAAWVCACWAGLLLVVRRSCSPARRCRPELPTRSASSVLSRVVALVTVSVVGPGQVRPGWAAPWTDPATVSGSSYTAGVVGAPVVTCTARSGVGALRLERRSLGARATGCTTAPEERPPRSWAARSRTRDQSVRLRHLLGRDAARLPVGDLGVGGVEQEVLLDHRPRPGQLHRRLTPR